MMELITTRGEIRTVPVRWHEQYRNYQRKDAAEKAAISRQLDDLDLETVTAKKIAAVIGNDSWTEIHCDECDKNVNVAVRVGQEPDYQSNTATVCVPCLKKALRLAERS